MQPSINYALHPYWPVRLGFLKALRVLNPSAAAILDKTSAVALSPPRARLATLRLCRDVIERNVPGDFVEFGVHRGGSAAVIASTLLGEPARHLHLFDRWGDLPEPTPEDGFRTLTHRRADRMDRIAKLHDTLPSAKRAVLEVAGLPEDRVSFYQGWFSDTISDYPGRPIAFASIDTDYYESTVPVLDRCEQIASPGAVFLIDDYGSWPGAKRATHEMLAKTRRDIKMSVTPMGTAILTFQD